MNKYIESIGIQESTCSPNMPVDFDPNDKRSERYKAQKTDYGFDERETWSLMDTSAEWLYSHLMMYLEIGGKAVNLAFHRFDIPVLEAIPESELKFEEGHTFPIAYQREVVKNMTQEEAINLCTEYLKEFLLHHDATADDTWSMTGDEIMRIEGTATEKGVQAFKIYGMILPAMWW